MLSDDEVAVLLRGVLGSSCEDRTFGASAKLLRSKFDETRLFSASSALVILLGDAFTAANYRLGMMDIRRNLPGNTGAFSLEQRLAALFLCWECYTEHALGFHPFLPVFLEIITDAKAKSDVIFQNDPDNTPRQVVERQFLERLLTGQKSVVDAIHEMTPKAFVKTFERTPSPDLTPIEHLCKDRQPNGSSPFRSLALRPVVRDYQDTHFDRRSEQSQEHNSDISVDPQSELTFMGFEPKYIRPDPPLLEVDESWGGELQWVDIAMPHELLWDTSMCSQHAGSRSVLLLQQALDAPLSVPHTEELLEALCNDEVSADSFGFRTDMVPDLVKHNPRIAGAVIMKVWAGPRVHEFLEAVVNLNMQDHQLGVHSMEVVNKLTNEIKMPKEFVQMYISNCINSAERIKDPISRTRLVRLLCVFLQTLIRNKIIDVNEALGIEIKAFSIENAHIRESAGLLRLVNELQGKTQDSKR